MKDQWVKHIIKEGSRHHVVAYDMKRGAYCTESIWCEYNQYNTAIHPDAKPPKRIWDGPPPGTPSDSEDLADPDDPCEQWARGEIWGD